MKIHPKYGLNPTTSQCFFCGKTKDVLLFGGEVDEEMPPSIGFTSMEPCDECKPLMEKGIMLISVRDEDQGKENPYRTGNGCIVTDEFIEKLVGDETLRNRILKQRWSFISDSVWDFIGL